MRYLGLIVALSFFTTTAFAKAPLAIIKRGIKEIPVDLSQASTKSQIKDYDVILLDEGVYSTLGDFKAKYVRVIGKGPQKTFISSTKTSPLIPVNSTEFWDLTIKDAKFRLTDMNGMWTVNVEFAGSFFITPASPEKAPAFFVRSILNDSTPSNVLYSTFVKAKSTAEDLIEMEKQLDVSTDTHLKNRMAFKGLVARGLNYLYQKGKHNPQYDLAKYTELTKKAQEAKTRGNMYASMIYWSEADYLSGHSRFDEVLKEITPMTQKVSQEGGCSVEAVALEETLYSKVPVASLPGPCRIQAFNVNSFGKANKESMIAAARQQYKIDRAEAFRERDSDEEFAVGAPAFIATQYTLVTDLSLPGMNKSYSSDIDAKKTGDNSIVQNIIDPIAKAFKERFASKIMAAKAKIASVDIGSKFDGLLIQALYAADQAEQNKYEELHEQQFGRKISSEGAISSAFAY